MKTRFEMTYFEVIGGKPKEGQHQEYRCSSFNGTTLAWLKYREGLGEYVSYDRDDSSAWPGQIHADIAAFLRQLNEEKHEQR